MHVRSFTLSSDTAHPRAGVPFDVTLSIRVAENVPGLQNVYLPAFFGPEELGDEREVVHSKRGTRYVETMRLVAHSGGPLTIGSAYFDAIDARDGAPKRFISNELHLQVEGPGARAASVFRWTFAAAAAVAVACIALLAALAARKPAAAPAAPPAPEPAAVPVEEPREPPLRSAFAALALRRDRASVMELRAILWRQLGAGSGATLSAVICRTASPGMQRLLTLVERAAFVEEAHLQSAIDAVLALREEMTV